MFPRKSARPIETARPSSCSLHCPSEGWQLFTKICSGSYWVFSSKVGAPAPFFITTVCSLRARIGRRTSSSRHRSHSHVATNVRLYISVQMFDTPVDGHVDHYLCLAVQRLKIKSSRFARLLASCHVQPEGDNLSYAWRNVVMLYALCVA